MKSKNGLNLMADKPSMFKEYSGIGALIAVLLGGGGTILSERGEGVQDAAFREADIVQDEKQAQLLQMYNDLNLKVSLLEQELEDDG